MIFVAILAIFLFAIVGLGVVVVLENINDSIKEVVTEINELRRHFERHP